LVILKPGSFYGVEGEMEKLKFLSKLETIPANVFDGLSQLKVLELTFNRLSIDIEPRYVQPPVTSGGIAS